MKDQKINFRSRNFFTTDSCGRFDTERQATLTGSSYSGVHRSGPLWSVEPEPGSVSRLMPADIMVPLEYKFNLTNIKTGEVLATTKGTKRYVEDGVERVPVKFGRVRGTLFLPSKLNRPAPAIITMYGSTNRGKVPEDRAAMFASRGFASFALAFFGVDDLPEMYSSLDIEYCEEAVDYILGLPEVAGNKVGINGMSKGADVGAAMMMFIGDKVGASVFHGPGYISFPGVFSYKGEVVEKTIIKSMHDIEGGLETLLRSPGRQIHFERSQAPILNLVGEDDAGPRVLANIAFDRARKSGKTNCKLIQYPQTGHLINLPHSPHCGESANPHFEKLNFGGQKQPHSLAQFEAWETTLDFFKKHL